LIDSERIRIGAMRLDGGDRGMSPVMPDGLPEDDRLGPLSLPTSWQALALHVRFSMGLQSEAMPIDGR
jgi:hypothetical protein